MPKLDASNFHARQTFNPDSRTEFPDNSFWRLVAGREVMIWVSIVPQLFLFAAEQADGPIAAEDNSVEA